MSFRRFRLQFKQLSRQTLTIKKREKVKNKNSFLGGGEGAGGGGGEVEAGAMRQTHVPQLKHFKHLTHD
jgi:hypothetical protein